MHLIYYCATITIFAVAGPRSDYGIPGVSRPRVPSTEEVIDGKTILTVPPQIMAEVKNSVWQSRAWTWQEDALSTRKLFLTETQYQLQCNETLGCSYHSEAYDSVLDLTWTHISGGKVKAGFVEVSEHKRVEDGEIDDVRRPTIKIFSTELIPSLSQFFPVTRLDI
jgi:hypothetical protein